MYTGGPQLFDELFIQPIHFYIIHCHLLIHFCMSNLDFFFYTADKHLEVLHNGTASH
jgi:hypothetical protein